MKPCVSSVASVAFRKDYWSPDFRHGETEDKLPVLALNIEQMNVWEDVSPRGGKEFPHRVASRSSPTRVAHQAAVLHFADRASEALAAILETKALAERSRERWRYAELQRLHGLLLATAGGDIAQIEAALRAPIDTAKEQKSISLNAPKPLTGNTAVEKDSIVRRLIFDITSARWSAAVEKTCKHLELRLGESDDYVVPPPGGRRLSQLLAD